LLGKIKPQREKNNTNFFSRKNVRNPGASETLKLKKNLLEVNHGEFSMTGIRID